MIPSPSLEPGAIYLGANGQVREVVSIGTSTLVYRMRNRGIRDCGPVIPLVGETREITIKRFAHWAEQEVA